MLRPVATAAVLVAISSLAVSAGERMPNSTELGAIEQALKTAGYSGWKEIEMEAGVWEVDDAMGADNKRYDLKLDPKSLQVTSKMADND